MLQLKHVESIAQGHAGALAGLLSTLLLYPLENIKTRMHEKAGQPNQHSLQQIIQQVLSTQGITGFYKGVTALALGNYISYGVYFFWYEYFKHAFQTNLSNPIALIKPSLASAVITSIITNPFWVVQSRMTFSGDGLNFYKKSVQMVTQEGFQSLFKGLEASLVLTINPIIQFFIYEIIKQKFTYSSHQNLVNFIAGAISKAIATIITYPYQLLRTKSHLAKDKPSYIKVMKQIINDEGIIGLFAGLSPKLCQSVLNSAFLLMFQEQIYEILRTIIIMFIIQLLKYRKKFRKLQKIKA